MGGALRRGGGLGKCQCTHAVGPSSACFLCTSSGGEVSPRTRGRYDILKRKKLVLTLAGLEGVTSRLLRPPGKWHSSSGMGVRRQIEAVRAAQTEA